MKTPEEVAREVECDRVGTALGSQCDTHGQSWPCNDSAVRYLAAYIRARDAEVRAETLAGLTYESCGTNRLGQPTRRLVGPVEVGEA